MVFIRLKTYNTMGLMVNVFFDMSDIHLLMLS